jgi:outer membrane protein assembly factor BamB
MGVRGERRQVHRRGRWLACALLVTLLAVACTPEWTTYHREPGRSGADLSAPSIVPVARAWTSPFVDGFVFAQPLVYRNRVYVATEHNTIYALDLASGAVAWSRHIAEPVRASSVPCPLNIDPLGITGTPVIDPAANTIFAVVETGPPAQHALVGLDVDTGSPRVLASGDPPGVDPAMDHQRPALALGNGRVYWAYGGSNCGTYHGKVVSVRTDGTSPLVYVAPTQNGGSIWGPSGPAIDAAGNVWVTTADGGSTTTFDRSNTVIKLSPTLQELGYFAPSNWAALNQAHHDLGSTGPLLLPGGYLFQVGKSGEAYVVRQSAPGGIGGQVASLSTGCNVSGGNAWSPGMVYMACLSGTRALKLGDPPSLQPAWQGPPDANGSPAFGGNAVWTVAVDGGGVLYALKPSDGSVLQSLTIGHMRHFTSPVIAGDTVIVATDRTVQAFRHA